MAIPQTYILGFGRDLLINIVGAIVLLGLAGCVYYLGAALLAVVLGALAVSCWCLARWCRQPDSLEPEPGTTYRFKGRFVIPSRKFRRILVHLSYWLVAVVVVILVISAFRLHVEQRQREAEMRQSIESMMDMVREMETADLPGMLEQVRKVLNEIADEAVRKRNDKALQVLRTGDPSQIQTYLVERRNRNRAKLRDHERGLVEDNIAVAAIALLRGDHATLSEALDEVEKYDPDNPQAINLRGQLWFRLGEWGKAEESFAKLLRLGEGDPHIAAASHANLGVLAQVRSDYPLAQTHYAQALRLLQELGERQGQGLLLGNLGVIEKALKNLSVAEQYFKEAIKIDRGLGNQKSLADHTNNLGDLLSIKGEREDAEEMLNESIAISREIGYREGVAKATGNLGLLYLDMGRPDAAEQAHQEALRINQELGRSEGIAICYGNLGVVELERNHPEVAREYLLDALRIFTDLGAREPMANQYVNLGIAEENLGNPAEARRWWGMAKDLYDEIGAGGRAQEMQEWIDGP